MNYWILGADFFALNLVEAKVYPWRLPLVHHVDMQG